MQKKSFLKWCVTFLMGISSGIPLLLTSQTLKAWMTDLNIDLTTIGLFSLVGIPYSFKFLWAPLLDRYIPPFLGRRRGWMLIAQIFIALFTILIGLTDPAASAATVALLALFLSFFSATQDIAVDAYRRENLEDRELGLGTSLYVAGYRIGMLIGGAAALWLADLIGWTGTYWVMAGSMVIGVIGTLIAPESPQVIAPQSLMQAVIEPIKDFFSKSEAWSLLVFILLYKVGDNMASAMTVPFIKSIGYTNSDWALAGNLGGMGATFAGAFLGGWMMLKIGINRSLWIFGVFQAISTYGFSILASLPMNISYLTSVVAFENLSSGMGTAAFTAFMATLTNRSFTAFQYALLTSLAAVPRTVLSSPTGKMAELMGWHSFFLFCAVVAVPGILLLARFAPWNRKE